MRTHDAIAEGRPDYCRPGGDLWAMPVVLGATGLLYGAPVALLPRLRDTPGELMGFGLVPALLLLCAALSGVWCARAVVVADGAGLRWRGGFGRWRRADWADVSDFYDRLTINDQSSRGRRTCVIATELGELRLGPGWSGLDSLRAAVLANAPAAVGREWRTDDGSGIGGAPKEFRYALGGQHWFLLVMFVLLVGLCGWLAVRIFPRAVETFALLGPGWGVASVVASAVAAFLPFAVFWPHAVHLRETRRRRGESVAVDAWGLRFRGCGGERIDARWDEVEDFFRAPDLRRPRSSLLVSHVVRLRGRTEVIEFGNVLPGRRLLERIIARHATQAALPEGTPNTTWRYVGSDETVGGEASRWSSGREGVGARVFHYRTRTWRAVLLLPTLFAALPLLLHGLAAAGITDPPRQGWGPFWAMVPVTLYAWWRYRGARIELDEDGITQRTPLGCRRVFWYEVADYRSAGDGVTRRGIVRAADGRRVEFWEGIGHLDELRSEIARRAPAPLTGWDAAEPGA